MADKNNIPNNQINLSTIILENILPDYSLAVDMTLGKGNDAKRILSINDKIKLIGFDIQKEAIEISERNLRSFSKQRYKLILDSHDKVDKYVDKADFFIYNLGYLPGANKNIITKAETTLESLKKSIDLLNLKGCIVLIFYLGHIGGKEEYNLCKEYLESLDQKRFTIIEFDFINQKNNPPKLILIERIK